MKVSLRFLFIFVITPFITLFLCTKKTEASYNHVVISEIYYNATGDDSKEEWIELYNPTNNDIDLTEYKILSNNDDEYEFEADTKILPGDLLVIAKDKDRFNEIYGFYPEIFGVKFHLADNGDYLVLKDKDDSVVDAISWGNVNYEDSLHFNCVATGHSIERDISSDSNLLIDEVHPNPDKKYEKIIYSDKIIISEILPQPDIGTNNEFVELKNTGDTEIDLTNWIIDDDDGGSSPYIITKDIKVGAGEFIIFYHTDTGIFLNDAGDKIRLVDPTGELKSMISYEKSYRGQSYANFSGTWRWTETVTPDSENIFSELVENDENVVKKVNISGARMKENESIVTVSGTVTASPNLLSAQYFYIEDGTGGIQVYNYNKDFPEILEGNLIEVTGELSEVNNERRIKINSKSDIKKISSGNIKIPQAISIDSVAEDMEGKYVKVVGVVEETSGSEFIIKKNESSIKVVIRSSTKIKKPRMKVGDEVSVCGIVSQYKDSYRLLPFKEEDVKIITSRVNELPCAGICQNIYVFIYLIYSALWIILLIVKKKRLRLHDELPKMLVREIPLRYMVILEAVRQLLPRVLLKLSG